MRTLHTTRTFALKSLLVLAIAFVAVPQSAFSQTPPAERVRVPSNGANIHMTAGSGSELLVVVPKGTTLTVVGRDKEWVQVQLTPELRKTGLVFRWYKNEDKGWMHDSTVEVVKP